MTDLSSFVPAVVADLATRSGNVVERVDGSMLSADISGFTALTERLSDQGRVGAETITSLINGCFEILISTADEWGGEVISFGGDALLVLFRGEGHALRSANAGLAMQIALHASSVAKDANLTMTVGVAEGPFHLFLVGSTHRTLLTTGPAASQVIDLEARAGHGETLVSRKIANAAQPDLDREDRLNGFALIGTPTAPFAPDTPATPDIDWGSFVCPPVREQFSAFAELGGEHRIATVDFVSISGIEAALERFGDQGTADHLGHFVDALNDAAGRGGVAILHTDVAPDGVKFLLCAGAPIGRGESADVMLNTALQIADTESPFAIKQGVQTGTMFAGFLGSDQCRTYTLMGDAVNTAARMLVPAEDRDVVAVDDVLTAARSLFRTDAIEPFKVKGKSEPMLASRVLAATDRSRRGPEAQRVVGRDRELRLLGATIDRPGTIAEIIGAAGAGKTTLVAEALASRPEARVVSASATLYGSAWAHGFARPLLRSATNLDLDADAGATGVALGELVDEVAPELRPLLPLLAVPFGAEVDNTPEADAIDERYWADRSIAAVMELLGAKCSDPTVFVLGDLHWIDDASAELVRQLLLAAGRHPWTFIVTRRPESRWALPDEDGLRAITVELSELGPDDIKAIAIDASYSALSDRALELIVERSHGNPLFAMELARAAGLSGAADGSDLPDSVEAVLSHRLDALPPNVRRLLRVAAVFGVDFSFERVKAVTEDDAHTVTAEVFDEVDLIERSGPDEFTFAHALYRDVAYEGLPFERRKAIHRSVGQLLEAEGAEGTEGLLALHFSAAEDHPRAFTYGWAAGQRAITDHAPNEAVDILARAMASVDESGSSPDIRCEVVLALGDAAKRCGRFEVASDAYERALDWVGDDSPERASLFLRNGELSERQGAYDEALRWYREGLEHLDAAGRRDGREATELQLAQAGVHMRTDDPASCWDLASRFAMADEERPETRLRANYLMILAGTYLPDVDISECGAEAVWLAEQVDDPVLEGNLYDNLGIAAYYRADWPEAQSCYTRGLDLREACGDFVGATTALYNLGELRLEQGDAGAAQEFFDDVLRRSTAAHYELMINASRMCSGRVALLRKDFETAQMLLKEALAGFDQMGSAGLVLETRSRLAELRLAEGNDGLARNLAVELLHARGAESGAIRARVLRIAATAAHGLGNMEEAATWADEAVEVSETENLNSETARGLLLRAELSPENLIDEIEAESILLRMGVTKDQLGGV